MGEIKKVYTIDGREFKGRAIIIASGAMERTNKYKGEEEFLGKGVSYYGSSFKLSSVYGINLLYFSQKVCGGYR